jgi:hypothetical protein
VPTFGFSLILEVLLPLKKGNKMKNPKYWGLYYKHITMEQHTLKMKTTV